MKKILLFILIIIFIPHPALCQDNVLEIGKIRRDREKKYYSGKLEFLDKLLSYQFVHFQSPEKKLPVKIDFTALVNAFTPRGPEIRIISRCISKGEGRILTHEKSLQQKMYLSSPNNNGVSRETRGLLIHQKHLMTRESIEKVVQRASHSKFNVLYPLIFVRSRLISV